MRHRIPSLVVMTALLTAIPVLADSLEWFGGNAPDGQYCASGGNGSGHLGQGSFRFVYNGPGAYEDSGTCNDPAGCYLGHWDGFEGQHYFIYIEGNNTNFYDYPACN